MFKIGVIGCNYWGRNILRNFIENTDCQITACSDSRPSNLKYVKERYPFVRTTLEPSELIDSPESDALVMTSDIYARYALARQAILNGKHLLLDKLIASSSQEAEELVELVQARGNILMTTNPLEYSPAGIKIKEIIDQGKSGKIYYIASSRINLGIYRQDMNVIWDLASHEISLYIYWLNAEPIKVWATGKAFADKVNCDTAIINMEFPLGTMANIQISWLAPTKLRMTIISGSRKMLVFDDTRSGEKIKIYDRGVALKNPQDFGEFQLTYREGDVVSPKLDTYEPLSKVVEHFLECIKKRKRPRTDGIKGIKVIKILEATERSLQNGGSMEEVR